MTLSVITPVAPGRSSYLGQASNSVHRLKEHITVQWLVVWDGTTVGTTPGADVEICTGEKGGISIARNLALPHIESELITTLDADDQLMLDGCLRAIELFEDKPEEGWIGFNRTFMDGLPTKHWNDQAGTWAPGELAKTWTAPFVFHPNSVVYRSDLVIQAGGWPAISCNEDLGLLLRISESKPGIFDPSILTRYRTWPRQEVAMKNYPHRKKEAFRIIETTINAIRLARNRPKITSPDNPGGAFGAEIR